MGFRGFASERPELGCSGSGEGFRFRVLAQSLGPGQIRRRVIYSRVPGFSVAVWKNFLSEEVSSIYYCFLL